MSSGPARQAIRCPYCQGDDTVDGDLHGVHGSLHFKPDGGPFFGMTSWLTEVSASMCVTCGNIWLWGDRQRVRELRERLR